MIDNTTGAFLRVSDGPMSLLGGEAPEDLREAVDPDACDQSAGHDTITDLWARASRRIPAFAAATPLGSYGAMYDMTPDGNPILDPSATVEGLYWAVGFSGHGFKLSPVDRPHDGRASAPTAPAPTTPSNPFRAARFREGNSLGAAHPYAASGHP